MDLDGAHLWGRGALRVGQGGSGLDEEQKVVEWLRSDGVSGPLRFL